MVILAGQYAIVRVGIMIQRERCQRGIRERIKKVRFVFRMWDIKCFVCRIMRGMLFHVVMVVGVLFWMVVGEVTPRGL
jgi:hypothetical protein